MASSKQAGKGKAPLRRGAKVTPKQTSASASKKTTKPKARRGATAVTASANKPVSKRKKKTGPSGSAGHLEATARTAQDEDAVSDEHEHCEERDAESKDPNAQAKAKGGRPTGAQGFNESDTMALLTLINEILPRGANEWDRVRELYNEQHAEIEDRATRTTDSLKSRFRHVLAPAAPSGKTRCSAVRDLAVDIQKRIAAKVHNVTVDDSQSVGGTSDNDDFGEGSDSGEGENEDSESNSGSQGTVNSCPSTQESSSAVAALSSSARRTEQTATNSGSKRSRQIQPKDLQRGSKATKVSNNRVSRGSGKALWTRHTEEQALYRGNREMQQFLSVQNARFKMQTQRSLPEWRC